jgi:imidazoleglycerol-phosphate dehydratase
MGRTAKTERKTKETEITAELELDGGGAAEIQTGIPFFNHMLEIFTRHGLFDIKIQAKGDIEVDYHHTVEDVGLTLGQAFKEALGDKQGISRFG